MSGQRDHLKLARNKKKEEEKNIYNRYLEGSLLGNKL
jgi:hypothetical protein